MTDDAGDQPPAVRAPGRGSAASGRVVAVAIVIVVAVAALAGRALLDVGGPRSLPGTPLTIQTDATAVPAGECGRQLVPPARLVVRGDALVLVAADGGADLDVVWPAGYAGRLDQGHGGLYDGRGFLVAVAGETVQERYFGSTAPDGAFHVCRVAGD